MRVSKLIDSLKALPEVTEVEKIVRLVSKTNEEYKEYLKELNAHAQQDITFELRVEHDLEHKFELVGYVRFDETAFAVLHDGSYYYCFGEDQNGNQYKCLLDLLDALTVYSNDFNTPVYMNFRKECELSDEELLDWEKTRSWRV